MTAPFKHQTTTGGDQTRMFFMLLDSDKVNQKDTIKIFILYKNFYALYALSKKTQQKSIMICSLLYKNPEHKEHNQSYHPTSFFKFPFKNTGFQEHKSKTLKSIRDQSINREIVYTQNKLQNKSIPR